jgi:acylphosphatase
MPKKGWKIGGIVQGVGFRYFVLREARSLGLRGFVKNLPDGSVEVCACGDAQCLDELERALSSGSLASAVYSVKPFEPPAGLDDTTSFDIEY